MKMFNSVTELESVKGQHLTFSYSSETTLNTLQKLKDHIEQIESSRIALHIELEFMDHVGPEFMHHFCHHPSTII